MRLGAYSALVQALCYLFGFILLFTTMNPAGLELETPLQKLEFLLDRAALFQLWNFVIYIVFGVALVVLAVALHRLIDRPEAIGMSIATAFGLIWAGLVITSGMIAMTGLPAAGELLASDPAAAGQLWSTLAVVQSALGGGIEFVGGLWVLLISVQALRRTRALPRALNLWGVGVGTSGLLTVVPGLSDLGAVFGLTQIVWFLALGLVLLRPLPMEAAPAQGR